MFSNHSHFEYLLFDLDETLYPHDAGLMQEMDRKIVEYISDILKLSFSDANKLRIELFLKYGTTLRGLQTRYKIDPEEYLRFVHHISLDNYIKPSPWLRTMLTSIPLPKIIFTNSDGAHAKRVLDQLGITDQFSMIFDVHAMNFDSKPSPQVYDALLRTLKAKGSQCILVDDSVRNLQTAKEKFNMFTIMIGSRLKTTTGVDIILDDLSLLGETLTRNVLF